MPANRMERHLIVYGNVQGVGFRTTVRQQAQALHLVGSVRNLEDGTVEICVQGEREDIVQFQVLIAEARGLIKVERISHTEIIPTQVYREFTILF